MQVQQYELVLNKPKRLTRTDRKKIAQLLTQHCGFKLVEIDDALSNAPVKIGSARSRKDLLAPYNAFKRAGLEVLIVRNRSQTSDVPSNDTISNQKVISLSELEAVVAEKKSAGKKIVHCHGVFDLLHLGHMRHLNSARKMGDILIVTVVPDRCVKGGPGRPVFKEEMRLEALANLSVVDYACCLEEPHAAQAIELLKPDVFVRGSDQNSSSNDFAVGVEEEDRAIQTVGARLRYTDNETLSSTQLINLHLDTYPHDTLQYLKRLISRYSISDVIRALERTRDLRVLVIGDTIIDEYHYCSALGKSAKESIVVNKYLSEECFPGGSLATANHAAQLSSNVELVTVLGRKQSYEDFIRSHLVRNIKPTFFYRQSCVTTVKRRFVSETRVKLFEICQIDDNYLSREEENSIAQYLKNNLKKFDLVIVNDFGHGMLSDPLKELLCSQAKVLALNVQTNGANQGFNLVTNYRRADLVCIDERELRLATRDRFSEVQTLIKKVAKKLDCRQMVTTLGSQGSVSFSSERGFHQTPAFAQQSIDKVGAGDAFFAFTAPCFAIGLSQELLGLIGNAVGALKVQIVGNRDPVKYQDLIRFLTRLMNV